jgi:hypothetical protein
MPVRTIKLWWLIAAFLSGLAFAMWAEDLILTSRENRLEFSAPRLHFLVDKPLERLKNASQVTFAMQTTVWTGVRTHEFRKNAVQFAVSYDLFEEKFKVIKLGTPLKTQEHLTKNAAEAWCVKEMAIDDISGLKGSDQVWARLEVRVLDGKESGPLFTRGNVSDSGISLTPLIDFFSRPVQQAQPSWTLDAGPFTLDELRRPGRGG